MKNLKVSQKLSVGFGVAVLFMIAVGIAGICELGKPVILAVTLAGAAVSVLAGLRISGLISKPLRDAVKMIGEMGMGHLDMRLNLDRKDEIGVMAGSMDRFADDLRNVVIGTMNRISLGDLSVRIEYKDGRDEIAAALNKTVESLNTVVRDMKKISAGDLSVKIEMRDCKDEISYVLKKTVESMNVVVGAVKRISEGDLNANIEPRGDKDVISAALKTAAESLRKLVINGGRQRADSGRRAGEQGCPAKRLRGRGIRPRRRRTQQSRRSVNVVGM